jgi:uncharacterized membrane protein
MSVARTTPASPLTAFTPPVPSRAAGAAPGDGSGAVPARQRLDALDAVRGLVMVLMLLDHVRDFVHVGGWMGDPLDLATTTPALYATRWITHLCAPTFVLLAGIGVALQRQRGATTAELRRFLLTRGAWLVLLELTAVRWCAFWDVDYRFLGGLQVIGAIGVAMLALGALIGLPQRVVGAIGLAIVAGHNLLDGIRVPEWAGPTSPVPGAAAKLWLVLHQGGAFPVAGWPSPVVMIVYPVLAWIGILAAGYGLGEAWRLATPRRVRVLAAVGGALVVAFLALRLTNAYGDPHPWTAQGDALHTALAVLRVEKYPPSLLFVCATLGPMLLLLAALEARRDGAWARRAPARWLVTFGRVPLFYYLLQWLWAHGVGFLLAAAAGHALWPYFVNPMVMFMRGLPPDYGFPLPVVWGAWIVGVVVLYLPCRWYAGVKARRTDWWLRYL